MTLKDFYMKHTMLTFVILLIVCCILVSIFVVPLLESASDKQPIREQIESENNVLLNVSDLEDFEELSVPEQETIMKSIPLVNDAWELFSDQIDTLQKQAVRS